MPNTIPYDGEESFDTGTARIQTPNSIQQPKLGNCANECAIFLYILFISYLLLPSCVSKHPLLVILVTPVTFVSCGPNSVRIGVEMDVASAGVSEQDEQGRRSPLAVPFVAFWVSHELLPAKLCRPWLWLEKKLCISG